MIPAEIIEKKRDGYELSAQEINWFIDKYDISEIIKLIETT